MNKVVLSFSAFLAIAIANSAQAMTCEQFNALGVKANSSDQVLKSDATEKQVQEYKEVIANHVSRVMGFGLFSSKKKALQVVIKNDQLIILVRESLAMTRMSCFNKLNAIMEEVAIGEFDYLLDAVIKKLNL